MKLIADHVTYEYEKDTEHSVRAVDDVSFVVNPGEMIAIIGHTGSGKSSLVQTLNGLIKPDSGTVYYDGMDIFEKGFDRKAMRGKVGLVFQYPEHQLFEETAFKDVCFGPKNMGVSRKETELRAYEALKMVGLEDDYFYQSPFDMSGGQRRRVAIAGVLAMKPEVLILDEPTAGLDPQGRREIFELIKKLKTKENIAVIIVSHSMEDVSEHADRLLVMNKGRLCFDDVPREVFKHYAELEEMGLQAPKVRYILEKMAAIMPGINKDVITLNEAAEEIVGAFKNR